MKESTRFLLAMASVAVVLIGFNLYAMWYFVMSHEQAHVVVYENYHADKITVSYQSFLLIPTGGQTTAEPGEMTEKEYADMKFLNTETDAYGYQIAPLVSVVTLGLSLVVVCLSIITTLSQGCHRF
jgi:hypothetical protein